MTFILNDKTGFIINHHKPLPITGGTCIRENCNKLSEFWGRGWEQTRLFVSHIKRADGVLIKHTNIYNDKTGKIIDVSNGYIKMLDVAEWRQWNNVIKLVSISKNSFKDPTAVTTEALIKTCDWVFQSYINGDDNWKLADTHKFIIESK